MRKLNVAVVDLVTKGPTRALYARVMNANLASIMPQILSVWCEEAGHDVKFICYTGFEDLEAELPRDTDLVFVSAFTQAAQLAYCISNLFQQRGAVTVLGGPHARCYPEDGLKYFDYVVGFADKPLIMDILADCERHRPLGTYVAADAQPTHLPGVQERWKFAQQALAKAPTIKIVPMIGSLGCPYTCSFCIDSVVDYQPLSFEQISSDLRFLLTQTKRPRVGWHDPNFGIRFNDYMDAIEEAVPSNKIDFVAESSLALLSEPHLKRLQKNGFKAILPGIESWYEVGNKSKTGKKQGFDKVEQIAEHVNMMMRYVPYVQANFVLGLDSDEGSEPFECTKRFIDLVPASFPAYSLLSAFGQAAPLNLELQRAGRVLPSPFHFLNNNHAMNVKPLNYKWTEFYDRVVDLTAYTWSGRSIRRRFMAQGSTISGWMNLMRAISSEGWGRLKYHRMIRELLDSDITMRRFFEGESREVPAFYRERLMQDLGPMGRYLPEGALEYNHLAYLHKHEAEQPVVQLQRAN